MINQPQPQPQPSPLETLLLNRIWEVELPAYVAAGLIVSSVCENWTDAQFRHERFKAKWLYFFEHLRDVEAGDEEGEGEEEIKMLRGQLPSFEKTACPSPESGDDRPID